MTGEMLLNGENVLDMSWGRLRAVRWGDASIVFQGAMHSLDPLQRIGRQMAEPVCCTTKRRPRALLAAASLELLGQVGLPERASQMPTRTNSRVVRNSES